MNLEKLPCKACHGSGTQYSTKSGMREECPSCEGRGIKIRPQVGFDRLFEEQAKRNAASTGIHPLTTI